MHKDLSPEEMREVLKNLTATEIGEWINICLGMLCDLLKLNAYRWSAEAPLDRTAVILCENPIPIMSVVDVDIEKREVVGLRGMYLTTSPRVIIFEMIKEITRLADSMFEEGAGYKFRVSGFREDATGADWSAMLR
jgi:hypothetical protein